MGHIRFRVPWRSIGRFVVSSCFVFSLAWSETASAQSNALAVSSVTLSGSNLVLTGSGALSGATYYVLVSTDLTLAPVSLWSTNSTNTFPADGAFTDSIPVDLTIPQEFFVIRMPLVYAISTSSSPTNGGFTAGSGMIPQGSNVTVCATASPCFGFVDWLDQNSNVLSTSACYSFTVTTNANLTASFVPLGFMIATSSSPAGGGTTSGGGVVPCGSNVTVCATNNGCYNFVNWTDQNSNVLTTAACYSFTATSNANLTANFSPINFNVTTSSSPAAGGSTSGGGTVVCGSNVTVCATNNSCYSFVNWTDQNSNVVSTTPCYSFMATTNSSLTATFALINYNITTSSSPAAGGSTSGGGVVACGSNVTVCATTNGCYSFVNWTDQNSNVVSTTACYSFTASTNRNLTAHFSQLGYTITTSSSPAAGGSTGG